jgi:hypothetical protein
MEPEGKKMEPQLLLEGTWEELAAHAEELRNFKKLRLSVVPEERTPEASLISPNERGLAILRQIAQHQQGRFSSSGEQTNRFIREGREGAMYADDYLK